MFVVAAGVEGRLQVEQEKADKKFTKRRIGVVGHSDEHVWELKVGRLQAEASTRRGAIPPLGSDFAR